MVNHIALNFFCNYLPNRCQFVSIDNSASSFLNISSDVLHGSVLGPLLFLIYASDLHKTVGECEFQSFADDTQLIHYFGTSDLE
nr:unnamed protein product [Callosobruchus chinensis]